MGIVGNAFRYSKFRFLFSKKGYAMVKFFGFVLAVASLVGSANAALLASWTFVDGSQGGEATTGDVFAGDQAGDFSGNSLGYTSTSISTSAAGLSLVRKAVFYLQASSASSATIDSFTFDALRGTSANPPSSTGVRTVRVSVEANKGSGTPDAGFVAGTNVTGLSVSPNSTSNLTNSYIEYEGLFSTPVTLLSGDILRLVVTYTASGTATAQTVNRLDNMKIFGSAVPEPTSMAVFGLLGAGIAARRIRRKA
jgi:hypothetical protein